MNKFTYPSKKNLRELQMNLKLFGLTQKRLARKIKKSESLISQIFSGVSISEPTINQIILTLKSISHQINF